MDPNATLRRLIDACNDEDKEAAIESLEDLLAWLKGGGFLPKLAT